MLLQCFNNYEIQSNTYLNTIPNTLSLQYINSVSYTHLDVYKRQIQICVTISVKLHMHQFTCCIKLPHSLLSFDETMDSSGRKEGNVVIGVFKND